MFKNSVRAEAPCYKGKRGDIDGLRAIAVLAVIGFHAFPNHVRGGFIGVDVFFVISGFLISQIILRDLEAGSFSLVNFYVRRARRIFPALTAVLLACLLFGGLVLFPPDFSLLGRETGAGAAFAANLLFWYETGYFDRAAELKPLLHLWSLGIEEQFYLVWPLLLLAAFRWRHGPLIAAGVVFFLSFAASAILSTVAPSTAFYCPGTRFWELMVGCILAVISSSRSSPATLGSIFDRHTTVAREAASIVGLVLLGASLAFVHPGRAFPGLWALLPTIGTALLITAGPNACTNRLLGARLAVSIGLVSYPLYLWHWPILSFARHIQFRPPTDLLKGLAISLAFVLAYWTYRYVETPIRFGQPRRYKVFVSSSALAAVGALGLLVFAADGLPNRFPPEAQRLAGDLGRETLVAARWGTCFVGNPVGFHAECDGEAGRPANMMLWGDSHAAHLAPGLRALATTDPNVVIAQYTMPVCPPVFGHANCSALEHVVVDRIVRLRPTTVVLAGNWALYEKMGVLAEIEAGFEATVKRLTAAGVQRVVAVGQAPLWITPPGRIRAAELRWATLPILRPAEAAPLPDRRRDVLEERAFQIDRRIRATFERAGAKFISPLDAFCNDKGCLLVTPDGDPLAWDDNHLSAPGAIYFTQIARREFTTERQ